MQQGIPRGLASLFRASQTSLCLAASPPPQISKERGAGWARPRPTGTTLFSSFLGWGGEEEKDV